MGKITQQVKRAKKEARMEMNYNFEKLKSLSYAFVEVFSEISQGLTVTQASKVWFSYSHNCTVANRVLKCSSFCKLFHSNLKPHHAIYTAVKTYAKFQIASISESEERGLKFYTVPY